MKVDSFIKLYLKEIISSGVIFYWSFHLMDLVQSYLRMENTECGNRTEVSKRRLFNNKTELYVHESATFNGLRN